MTECAGACCRLLPLAVSVGELQASAQAAAWGRSTFTWKGQPRPLIHQAAQLLDMLRLVGLVYGGVLYGRKLEGQRYLYTCRHHQADGSCEVYESRPDMCRDFPGGAVCPYVGCSLRGRGCTP